MKKILILLLIPLLLTGCIKQKNITKENQPLPDNKKEEVIETYKDDNNTPISIYELNGNTLTKQTKIIKNLTSMEDIGIFQIYPSTENEIKVSNFGNDFYNEFQKYNSNNNLKIGFSLEFNTSEETISYLVLNPTNAMEKWEYIMGYLYDDYLNRDKSFYSHIEEAEYNENNLFTSIKLQSGYQVDKITSPIKLKVFTYDSDDDIKDNKYIGNSSYEITICKDNNC